MKVSDPEEPDLRFFAGVGFFIGALIGLGMLIPATILAFTMEGPLPRRVLVPLTLVAIYPLTGLAGGALVWFSMPVLRFWIARRLMGIVVMLPATAGVALMLHAAGEPGPIRVGVWIFTAVVAGTAFSFVPEDDARRTWIRRSRRRV